LDLQTGRSLGTVRLKASPEKLIAGHHRAYVAEQDDKGGFWLQSINLKARKVEATVSLSADDVFSLLMDDKTNEIVSLQSGPKDNLTLAVFSPGLKQRVYATCSGVVPTSALAAPAGSAGTAVYIADGPHGKISVVPMSAITRK